MLPNEDRKRSPSGKALDFQQWFLEGFPWKPQNFFKPNAEVFKSQLDHLFGIILALYQNVPVLVIKAEVPALKQFKNQYLEKAYACCLVSGYLLSGQRNL